MRILVVNMDGAEQRMGRMASQLSALGLQWERVPSVDGNALTDQDYTLIDQDCQMRFGLRISPGEMGCWLGHRKAHRMIAEAGDEMTLVLEDDVEVSPELPGVLEHVESGGAGDFDIIHLHRYKPWRKYTPLRKIGQGYTLGLVRPVDPGAQACVFTGWAARHFIERVPRMVHIIDWALSRYRDHGLVVCSLDPPMVRHVNGGDSLIATRVPGQSGGMPVLQWLRRRRTHLSEAVYRELAYHAQLRLGRAGRLSSGRVIVKSGV